MSITFPSMGADAAPIPTQVTSLDKEVQGHISASLSGTAPDVTILSTDTHANMLARMPTILKAAGMPALMAQDASHVMDALVPTMQSVIDQRPDLANAKFDFQTDNGHLKVVSSTMSAKDKAWLEDQLNSNKALVSATQSFHEHAVEGYQLWASLGKSPSSNIDTAAISAAADNKFGFMDIFQRYGETFARFTDPNSSYYTSDGTAIDFDLVPNTAANLLRFAKAAKAVEVGAIRHDDPSGRSLYGTIKGSIFFYEAMPDFRPTNDANTLGLSARA